MGIPRALVFHSQPIPLTLIAASVKGDCENANGLIYFSSDTKETERRLSELFDAECRPLIVCSQVLHGSILDCSSGTELAKVVKEHLPNAFFVLLASFMIQNTSSSVDLILSENDNRRNRVTEALIKLARVATVDNVDYARLFAPR